MDKSDIQIELENTYAKNHLHKRIRQEFIDNGYADAVVKAGFSREFGLSLLVHIYIHKRASVSVMVGILAHHFKNEDNPYQACADELHRAVQTGICLWDSIGDRFQMRYGLSPSVEAELDRFQYPLPMVTEPEEVRDNNHIGYKTIKKSIILNDGFSKEDVNLDHINTVNKIKWKVNNKVLSSLRNEKMIQKVNQRKEGESGPEWEARKRQFMKFDKVSRDVIDGLNIISDEFYFTHSYDKRGRVYANGYHLNYMGMEYSKGILEFAEKEYVEN